MGALPSRGLGSVWWSEYCRGRQEARALSPLYQVQAGTSGKSPHPPGKQRAGSGDLQGLPVEHSGQPLIRLLP